MPPRPTTKHTPPTAKKDQYAYTGWQLQQASQAAEPLGRILAVTRLSLSLMLDVLRPGSGRPGAQSDPQDTPVTLLGDHYLSHRKLGDYPDGTSDRVYVQEICTFDREEGPKLLRKRESAAPQAALSWWVDPTARAKYKRISGKRYAKIRLAGGGRVSFFSLAAPYHAVDSPLDAFAVHQAGLPAGAGAGASSEPSQPSVGGKHQRGAAATASSPSAGTAAVSLMEEEVYQIVMPDLVLHEPLSACCRPEWKGYLTVNCAESGLHASLSFKHGEVRGTVDAHESGSVDLRSRITRIGTFRGSLMGVVEVVCPSLGLEGIVHDCTTGGGATSGTATAPSAAHQLQLPQPPPPLVCLDLLRLGPMRLPRLWSALHDALIYNDPALAAGGKVAEVLSCALASSLKSLFLTPLESRDLPPLNGTLTTATAAAGGGAASAAAAAGEDRGLTAAPAGAGGSSNSSGSEEDQARPPAVGGPAGQLVATADTRAMPPCYKAAHAAGNKLRWQLHMHLERMPNLLVAEEQPGP